MAIRTCPNCGIQFIPSPPNRRFCRPTCQARFQLQRRGQRVLPLFDVLATELPDRAETRKPRRGAKRHP